MKKLTIFLTLLLTFATTADAARPLGMFENLAANADYTETVDNVPEHWSLYGKDEPAFGDMVISCGTPYTEDDLRNQDPNDPDKRFIFRPSCPPYAQYRLQTYLGDNDVVGWYFEPVQIDKKRKFYLSFDYQPYTHHAVAMLEYTMKDGSVVEEHLLDMPVTGGGAHGYIGWTFAEAAFVAPKHAETVTVKFLIDETTPPTTNSFGPDRGALSIANVDLRNKKPSPKRETIRWGTTPISN